MEHSNSYKNQAKAREKYKIWQPGTNHSGVTKTAEWEMDQNLHPSLSSHFVLAEIEITDREVFQQQLVKY